VLGVGPVFRHRQAFTLALFTENNATLSGKKELRHKIYPELDEGFNPSRKNQPENQ
jgi:hypothetical protein